MAWYTILFTVVFGLFALQLLLSWFAGEFEMDVDLDGSDDIDISGIFSFKGILHFLMGVSSYLFLKANMASVDKINGVAQFGILDYMWSIVVGIVLMVFLFFGYKLALRANATPVTPNDLLDGSKATVSFNLGNGLYYVHAHTAAGTTRVQAFYTSDDLEVGTEVTLSKDGSKILINNIVDETHTNK